MTVINKIAGWKRLVEEELEKILQGDSPLLRAMRYSVLSGGKRYRPLLAFASGEAFGVSPAEVLPFAASVELIHNYSLIHDDLPAMDNDDFRRGIPSCHRAFGQDMALLAGDALLTLAFETLTGGSLSPGCERRRIALIGAFARAAGLDGMIGGQVLDISLSPEEVTEENSWDLIRRKTGALIRLSARVGALLTETSPEQMAAIERFGDRLGLAFQVRDDIQDAGQDAGEMRPARPNIASRFGGEKARGYLDCFIQEGMSALEELPGPTEALRHLGMLLKEIKDAEPNTKDYR